MSSILFQRRSNLIAVVKVGRMAVTVMLLFSSTLLTQANDARGNVQEGNVEKRVIAFYSFGEWASADKSMRALILCLINEDGSGERYLDFGVPGQISWQLGPYPQLADGRRTIVMSWGTAAYTQLRGTKGEIQFHTWVCDLQTGKLQEILNKGSLPPDTRPVLLLPGEKRMIVATTGNGNHSALIVDVDGRNPDELIGIASGFAYSFDLGPDAHRLAFHITGGPWGDLKKPSPFSLGHYDINVLNLKTRERILVAGAPGHHYFGPTWSPDGQWLAYLDCHHKNGSPNFRSDVCVGKTDGTENRVLTKGQPHWFGADYGAGEYRTGGSNPVLWSPDGANVLFTRLLANSVSNTSQGGSQLCLISPITRKITELTASEESLWVHHANWSRDGKRIVYLRDKAGHTTELWIMNSDGTDQRMLTRGYKQRGVQHGGVFLDK